MDTALIIGAGPGIGLSTVRTFQNAGYSVAIASRTRHENADPAFRHIVFDAAKPDTVKALFEEVTAALGPPKVVVYNAAQRFATEPEDPFVLDLDQVQETMAVNATSTYAAAREAVKGFQKMGPGSTFIMTGNKLNTTALPGVLCFGTGKSAAAHMIQKASVAYKNKATSDFTYVSFTTTEKTRGAIPPAFYCVDQRQPDGGPTIPMDGAAHAKLYLDLVNDTEQRQWDYTFVDGQGYVKFST